MTKFILQLNQYKLNIKLCGEVKLEFELEKVTEHFCQNHSWTHKHISFKINDYCNSNDREKRDGFWIHYLDIFFLK